MMLIELMTIPAIESAEMCLGLSAITIEHIEMIRAMMLPARVICQLAQQQQKREAMLSTKPILVRGLAVETLSKSLSGV